MSQWKVPWKLVKIDGPKQTPRNLIFNTKEQMQQNNAEYPG